MDAKANGEDPKRLPQNLLEVVSALIQYVDTVDQKKKQTPQQISR